MTHADTQRVVTLSAAVAGLMACAGLYYWARTANQPVSMSEPATGSAAPAEAPSPAPPEPPGGGGSETLAALATDLAAKDFASFKERVGTALSAEAVQALEQALGSGDWRIDPRKPVTELGGGETDKWAINLINPSSDKTARLTVDLAAQPDGSARVRSLGVPDLPRRETLAGEAEDAAREFFAFVERQDFTSAKARIDPQGVSDEKLAALGLLLEEGQFRLEPGKPTLATNANEERAWTLVRVTSDLLKSRSEFGLEMKRVDGAWRIERINFSRLMSEFLRAKDVPEIEGSPVVENPRGGESIALYFHYDDSQLTEKSLRQLGIIAAVLKGRKESKLRISGHADSMGEDVYNDKLSGKRAEQVRAALGTLGVPMSQIVTEAHGERQPLSPNTLPDGADNPEGRRKNRRSEIFLDF